MEPVEKSWTKLRELPYLRVVGHLVKAIPDVPLTAELKLWYAIFGEPAGYTKSRLIEAYLQLHLPKGDWEEYKRECTEWVTYLLQESISRETALIKEPIPDILTTLVPREQRVIELRFGFDGVTRTLDQTAIHFEVSRERIRQIEAKALRKLRHPSRSRRLKHLNPGEWLRARVLLECEIQHNYPVLALFWMIDRKELKSRREDLAELEKELGVPLLPTIKEIQRDHESMARQVAYMSSLLKGIYRKPITELGWSIRIINCLRRKFGNASPTLGEVAALSDKELLAIRNFGEVSLHELRQNLELIAEHGPLGGNDGGKVRIQT